LTDSYVFRVAVFRFSKTAAIKFGENIAQLRQDIGLTQDKLAERLDISTRYLQKLERGLATPSFALLIQLRKSLKTDWNALLVDL
jgi:transcriptional regulator with XRE-family HTH domain